VFVRKTAYRKPTQCQRVVVLQYQSRREHSASAAAPAPRHLRASLSPAQPLAQIHGVAGLLIRIFVPPPAPSPEQAGRYSVAA